MYQIGQQKFTKANLMRIQAQIRKLLQMITRSGEAGFGFFT
ncbi:hypothetical protein [Desulfogranum mediterraneum]|nr:hypothetical protein [Desulfogranum mediterraneum]